MLKKRILALCLGCIYSSLISVAGFDPAPFGEDRVNLDSGATGDWWLKQHEGNQEWLNGLKVPRKDVICFAIYTHHKGILKMTAQMYPLYPDEEQNVRLEIKAGNKWTEISRAEVIYPGWSAHFRIENWDNSKDVTYRVLHGNEAKFQGLIRKDPTNREQIIVASFSCNSKADRGDREDIIANLKYQDPDLLFFAGDQSYDHSQHTAALLLWGKQFREVLRDRPTITIPDDHDIGQANIWGEEGRLPPDGAPSGGYSMPVEYVKMVERCQTSHLPDPFDPTPVKRGIQVYYTSLNVGEIDFAILEDRKFKSGPKGRLPHYEPVRPDHINDPAYDPATIDLPGLKLLGDRQLKFLHEWGQDWTDTIMKCVLSQTNFAGAVHLHGYTDNRLLADLDCNGWPQTGRNKALIEIRRALACHLAGDQHLAVVTQHGIDAFRDGPFSFVNPAIANSIYGRWWWPIDDKPGGNPIKESPLPWTGDYLDGLGNRITMYAYANPDNDHLYPYTDKRLLPPDNRGDGYALVRFNKQDRTIIFECWPRHADASKGDIAQYPGWPVTIRMEDNDGRKVAGYLPELVFPKGSQPVVQVIDESTHEILYTRRVFVDEFQPHVYRPGRYTVKIGSAQPDGPAFKGLEAVPESTKSIIISDLD